MKSKAQQELQVFTAGRSVWPVAVSDQSQCLTGRSVWPVAVSDQSPKPLTLQFPQLLLLLIQPQQKWLG